MRKITLTLPAPLLLAAKRAATARGITLSTFAEVAVRTELTRDYAKPVPPFSLLTVRGKLVQPGLDLDLTAALIESDDESAFLS